MQFTARGHAAQVLQEQAGPPVFGAIRENEESAAIGKLLEQLGEDARTHEVAPLRIVEHHDDRPFARCRGKNRAQFRCGSGDEFLTGRRNLNRLVGELHSRFHRERGKEF